MEKMDLDHFLESDVNLGQFFKGEELKAMNDGEQQRLRNIAQNYEIMVYMGFPAIKPDFMKCPAQRANKLKEVKQIELISDQSSSSDSDDETWTPDLERRKRAKEVKKPCSSFTAAKKCKSNTTDEQVKKPKHLKAASSEEVGKQYNLRERTKANCMILEVPDDDHFVFCEECNKEYDMDCPVHGPLDHIGDSEVSGEFDADRALHSLPPGLVVKESNIPDAGLGVFAEREIPARVMFGPYGGVKSFDQQKAHDSGYCWQIHAEGKPSHFVDAQNKASSNWMRYVNCAPTENEQNLVAFQYKGGIYYRSYKVITAGCELLCWYGNEYGRELGLVRDKNLLIRPKLVNGGECFPCVFCKTIFSTVVYNVRHLVRCHGHNKLTKTDLQTLDEWLRKNDKEEYEDQLKNVSKKAITKNGFPRNKNLIISKKKNMEEVEIRKCSRKKDECQNDKYYQQHKKKIKELECNTFQSDSTRIKGKINCTCDVCGSAFTHSGNLKHHMRIHYGEKPFKCDVCGSAFTRSGDLKGHMRIHSGENPLKCDVCGTAFTRSGDLKGHMRIHSGEKPFKCDVCGSAFTQSGDLKRHMRIHSGEKPFKCDVCGSAFTQSGNLKVHMRIHSGEKPFKCDVCGSAFTQSGELTGHMRIHSGEKPFKCDVCGSAFTQSGDLKRHMRIHSGEKPFKCDVCGSAFTGSGHLKGHMRIHSGEKPFKCDVCGSAFTQSGDLKRHMRIHSGEKPFKCDVCGSAFTGSGHLKGHMRIHSGEKPFKCDVCGSAFTQSGNLKVHMRIHSGEKPFKCDVCGSAFTGSGELTGHMRIHSGEKPFKCDVCGSAFTQSGDLKRHMRIHSGEIPL